MMSWWFNEEIIKRESPSWSHSGSHGLYSLGRMWSITSPSAQMLSITSTDSPARQRTGAVNLWQVACLENHVFHREVQGFLLS